MASTSLVRGWGGGVFGFENIINEPTCLEKSKNSLATGLEQKETGLKHLEMWDLGKRGLTMHKALLAFSYVFINLLLFSRSVVSDSFGTP